jgi:hypothetical protein
MLLDATSILATDICARSVKEVTAIGLWTGSSSPAQMRWSEHNNKVMHAVFNIARWFQYTYTGSVQVLMRRSTMVMAEGVVVAPRVGNN